MKKCLPNYFGNHFAVEGIGGIATRMQNSKATVDSPALSFSASQASLPA